MAILLWVDADPARASTYIPGFFPDMAFRDTEDPDLVPEPWQRRGAALQALIAVQGVMTATETLLDRVRADGWPATLEWLDGFDGSERHLRVVR